MVKAEPNVVVNGEMNWNFDWIGQVMIWYHVIMGQNSNISQGKLENGSKLVQTELDMVGNGDMNWNLDWNGQEMMR